MDFRLCVLWGSTRQAFQTVPAEDLRAPFRARPSGMREASPEVHSAPTEVLRAARVGLGRCSKERAKTEGKRGGLKGWSKHQDKNSGTKIHLYLRSKTCMFFLSGGFVPPVGRPFRTTSDTICAGCFVSCFSNHLFLPNSAMRCWTPKLWSHRCVSKNASKAPA